MNTKSLNRETYQSWPEAVMLGIVSIFVIMAALLLIRPSSPEQNETYVATHDVARYGTLAGVAGVRALDRDISPEARYAAANGVAAVRALDEWASR